jgi:hypothetical protein
MAYPRFCISSPNSTPRCIGTEANTAVTSPFGVSTDIMFLSPLLIPFLLKSEMVPVLNKIIKSTMKTQNSRFLENLVNFIRHNSETKLHNAFLRIFQEKIFNQIIRINEEIQINRVLGVLGSNLLIQTNHLEYFGVIKIDDLIGRNFY